MSNRDVAHIVWYIECEVLYCCITVICCGSGGVGNKNEKCASCEQKIQ